MDFSLTEEQQILTDTLDRFVEREYSPERRRELAASERGYSEHNWRLFAELGLLGLIIPEEFGGMSGTPAEVLLVMERFGHGLILEPFLSTAVIGAGLINEAGTQEQKERLLPAIASGELKTALASLEPEGYFDLWHVRTTANRTAEGYKLAGRKCVVADGASANLLIVTARTDGSSTDCDGISLFLVDTDTEGLSIKNFPSIDGARTAEIELSDVEVSRASLLGAQGAGFALLEKGVDRGIAGLCAEAVGVMDQTNSITAEYLRTRHQFGKPIGSFQALQHRYADMLIKAEQARAMAYCAGAHIGDEDAIERRLAISAAKAMIGNCGRFVAQQAIQLHGGIGMTDEYSVGHFAKRLNCIDMSWGNSDHHAELYSNAMRVG